MSVKKQFPCKYIWGARDLEGALDKEKNRIAMQRGFVIDRATLTFQLAKDIKDGVVSIDPVTMRFRKNNIVRIGQINVKVQKR